MNVAGGARLRCRVIYPEMCQEMPRVYVCVSCCVCISRYTPAHVSGPVSFVILPYRRFFSSLFPSFSLSLSPSPPVDGDLPFPFPHSLATGRARGNAMCQSLPRVSAPRSGEHHRRNTLRWSSTISGMYDGGAPGAATERKTIETDTGTGRDHSTSLAITRLSPSCHLGSSLPVAPRALGRPRSRSGAFGRARASSAALGRLRPRSAVFGRAR